MNAFEQAVEIIIKNEGRYPKEAYYFLQRALNFTLDRAKKQEQKGEGHHVDAEELLWGYRDFSLQEFGPLAWPVMRDWNVHQCSDVGTMVFQLIDEGVMGRNEEDRQEDFKEVYQMKESLQEPFLPLSKKKNE